MGQQALSDFQPVKGFFYSPFAALMFSWTAYMSTREAPLVWGYDHFYPGESLAGI
jgi:hypothetical protein